jgi:RNA polymerase sigma-70 factor (ECF subfamily)
MNTIDIFETFRRDEELGFNLIYLGCREPLAKFAFKLTRRTDAAEDAASDAFLLLWKRRRQFESYIHIKRFLYLTVRKRCRTERRKLRKWFGILPSNWDQIDPDASELAFLKELNAHNQWIVNKIVLHLEDLPDQRAQDLQAFVFDLKSYNDIARERRVAAGTVRQNVLLAVKDLEKYLGDNAYPGFPKKS